MKKLVPAHIVLGEPLPFSVFDDRGNLLLRKGIVVTMEDQVDRLVLRGALIEGNEDDPPLPYGNQPARPVAPRPVAREPAFERVAGLAMNLKHIIATAMRTPEQIDVGARIGKIARAIQETSQEDIDSVLAAPYLDAQSPYIVAHLIMGGVVTEVLARSKGLAPEERLSLVCAALTRDWGQLNLQAELDARSGPLSPELQQKMRQHPERGAEQLRQAGITDPLWLEAVANHHERLDGSGYPQGLSGDAVSIGWRIVALADVYSAMIRPRPYRDKTYFPQTALRELYMNGRAELGEELTATLIREIGILPPGSIVKLKCGEVAVVKSPTARAEGATVYSVYGKSGMVLAQPVIRDTGAPDYAITGMLSFAECRSASITIKRVWLGI